MICDGSHRLLRNDKLLFSKFLLSLYVYAKIEERSNYKHIGQHLINYCSPPSLFCVVRDECVFKMLKILEKCQRGR